MTVACLWCRVVGDVGSKRQSRGQWRGKMVGPDPSRFSGRHLPLDGFLSIAPSRRTTDLYRQRTEKDKEDTQVGLVNRGYDLYSQRMGRTLESEAASLAHDILCMKESQRAGVQVMEIFGDCHWPRKLGGRERLAVAL